jgi:hypothetical protein
MIGEDKLIRFSGVKSGEVRPQPLVVKSRSTLHAARSTLTPGLLFPAISCFPRLFPAVSDARLPHCRAIRCLPCDFVSRDFVSCDFVSRDFVSRSNPARCTSRPSAPKNHPPTTWPVALDS